MLILKKRVKRCLRLPVTLRSYDSVSLLKCSIWKEVGIVQLGTEIAHKTSKSHLMTHSVPGIPSAYPLTDTDTLCSQTHSSSLKAITWCSLYWGLFSVMSHMFNCAWEANKRWKHLNVEKVTVFCIKIDEHFYY